MQCILGKINFRKDFYMQPICTSSLQNFIMQKSGCYMMTPLLSHSTCSISITRDSVKHNLIKHIDVDVYYTPAQVQSGVIALQYVPSEL
jgi:hypothetical protein